MIKNGAAGKVPLVGISNRTVELTSYSKTFAETGIAM